MSRVDACRLAVTKPVLPIVNCGAASDAFFPFRDGIDILAEAGVTAAVAPGGSIRDQEIVAAADEQQHGVSDGAPPPLPSLMAREARRRRRGCCFWRARSAAAQTAPPAPLPADAAALLSKAAALYADGSAHAAGFTQIYTPSGFATSRRESGQVWIQAPQRLRFDYAAPEKKTFTYDSGEGRFFSPEDKQLTIRKLSPEETARLPIVFLSRPEELAQRYDIQRDAGKAPVLFKPRAPDPDLAWLKLAIAPDGHGRRPCPTRTRPEAGPSSASRAGRARRRRPPADFKITGRRERGSSKTEERRCVGRRCERRDEPPHDA